MEELGVGRGSTEKGQTRHGEGCDGVRGSNSRDRQAWVGAAGSRGEMLWREDGEGREEDAGEAGEGVFVVGGGDVEVLRRNAWRLVGRVGGGVEDARVRGGKGRTD